MHLEFHIQRDDDMQINLIRSTAVGNVTEVTLKWGQRSPRGWRRGVMSTMLVRCTNARTRKASCKKPVLIVQTWNWTFSNLFSVICTGHPLMILALNHTHLTNYESSLAYRELVSLFLSHYCPLQHFASSLLKNIIHHALCTGKHQQTVTSIS